MEKEATPKLTGIQWAICFVAVIGFAFDSYELLVLPLIIRPALAELGNIQLGSPEYGYWRDLLFFLPAICGGIFGLLGGYLTDLLGRRRVLVWSILLYAFSALAAGFSTSLPWLVFFRCTTFIGVCVEFVAAVAWIAELFSIPKQRESVLGYTQAFSSIGGMMVTAAYFLCVKYADSLPAIHGTHEAWRYTLISGVIPALPLMIIRPFLPESAIWKRKKEEGTLERPSFAELFRPAYRKTTLITMVMVACSYAVAYGAIQHLPQIVPGLAQVASQAKQLPPPEKQKLVQKIVSGVQFFQETGGLFGRILLAILAIRILSRRKLLRVFQIPGLFVLPFVFSYFAVNDLQMLKWGILVAGLLTVGQFSFWGNYLPRVYPTHLRGTGESFAANIGGRMIGTSAALLTTQVVKFMPAASPATKLAYAAAIVGFLAYAIGFLASFWLPEPEHQELPE